MLTIDDIRAAIADRAGGLWVAEETPIYRSGVEKGDPDSTLFGLDVTDDTGLRGASSDIFEALTAGAPPRAVDWRATGFVTPVKDQGRCGACVAFATCAAMEASHWIRTGRREILSEGHLFHCNGGSCRHGWGLTRGLDAARVGVGLASHLPWSIDGECRRIPPVVHVAAYRAHSGVAAQKRAVAAGPVLAGMKVHQDLLAYRGGIYRHVIGDFVGNHAVCIVGYEDADQAWIVKNSWGDRWGDGGFVRIEYGQCGIDEGAFFSVETAP